MSTLATSAQSTAVQKLAASVRRARNSQRGKQGETIKSFGAGSYGSNSGGSSDLADEILAAIEINGPLPSRRAFRGPTFEDITMEEVFAPSSNVEFAEALGIERLMKHRHGSAILEALKACKESEEDEAHLEGPDGEQLEYIMSGRGDRIKVVRVVDPFNPVALYTPPSSKPLAAVTVTDIAMGEPIALYLGDLVTEDDPSIDAATNAYLFELGHDELAARGYKSPVRLGLRVDASRRGGVARFVNDKESFGLPARRANSYLEVIFDEHEKEWAVVLFASDTIPKGSEVIVDYGPDYWKVALPNLLRDHTTPTDGTARSSSSASGRQAKSTSGLKRRRSS